MTAVAAKALSSNGGRQALMEAQRYPENFDGIIAGDPSFGTLGSLRRTLVYQTMLSSPERTIPASKLNPTAFDTLRYYEDVVKAAGGRERSDQFIRLVMVPGMHHCQSNGPGPNTFDMLTALENWVERGVAPTRIVASHTVGGVVDRTRPICAYPEVARYTGSGSIDAAENFRCVAPSPAPTRATERESR